MSKQCCLVGCLDRLVFVFCLDRVGSDFSGGRSMCLELSQ